MKQTPTEAAAEPPKAHATFKPATNDTEDRTPEIEQSLDERVREGTLMRHGPGRLEAVLFVALLLAALTGCRSVEHRASPTRPPESPPAAGALTGGEYTLRGGFWGGGVVTGRFEICLPLTLRGH